ncbi:MAG: hypothetical protein Tsb002_21380 [Wenzhouxiangellaceae bacterium]
MFAYVLRFSTWLLAVSMLLLPVIACSQTDERLGPGGPRSLPIAFLNFDGLFTSNSGDIYAAEGFSGSRIFRIGRDGQTVIFADGLNGPIDIAEDSAGNLYVTNFNTATVSRIDVNGAVSDFADVLPFPAGIIADAADNLYVTHYGAPDPTTGFGTGDTVLRIATDGSTSIFSQGGDLLAPVGITMDDDGALYTANFHTGAVLKILADGSQSSVAALTQPGVTFAIGHLEYANNRLYATGIQVQGLYRVNLQNGQVNLRDISKRVDFPNGITFDPSSGSMLISGAFRPSAALFRVRVPQR